MNPLSLVIFGASGDLTARKLVPALFQAFTKGRLPGTFRIVGVSRSKLSDDQFRTHLVTWVKDAVGRAWDEAKWRDFAGRLFYVPADATAAGGLDGLRAWLEQHEGPGTADRLYYLSVAPDLVPGIAGRLNEAGLADDSKG